MLDQKLAAFSKLLNDYTDIYCRTTLYHNSLSNPQIARYDSENGHLFTGQASLLSMLHKQKNYDDYYTPWLKTRMNVIEVFLKTKVQSGLHARQPNDYVNDPKFHALSHDEHNGIMFYLVGSNMKGHATEFVTYGQSHNWAYIEESPNLDPIKEILKTPLKSAITLLKTAYNTIVKKVSTPNEQKSLLTRVRLPADRGLMKMTSPYHNPNWFEKLNITIAILLSSRKPVRSTSSKIMTFFKLVLIGELGYNNGILRFSRNYYHKKMVETYGEEYLSELYDIYFKDRNHPFHILSKGITL